MSQISILNQKISLIICYFSFNETDLLTNNSYCETLLQSGVMDIVNVNRKVFKPYSDKLDAALFQFSQREELELDSSFVGNTT